MDGRWRGGGGKLLGVGLGGRGQGGEEGAQHRCSGAGERSEWP